MNVTEARNYTFDFRYASAASGGIFHIEVDGVRVAGDISVNNTGGWTKWATLTKSGVGMTAGQHVIRIAFDSAGTNGYVANFNWWKAS